MATPSSQTSPCACAACADWVVLRAAVSQHRKCLAWLLVPVAALCLAL